MKRIPVSKLRADTIINQTLYDKRYNVLVQRGTMLNQKMLDSIKHYGYLSVYVVDTGEEVVCEKADTPCLPLDQLNELMKLITKSEQEYKCYLKKRAYNNSIALYKKYIDRRSQIVSQLLKLVEDIILYFAKNKVKSFRYFESKSLIIYSTQHAIQTGILAVLMGMEMSLTMNELKVLFVSSVLMEFSNLVIPAEILEKKGKLTNEEFEIVKKHTTFYVDEFHDCDKIHHLVRVVTQQHHERYDGSGYPLGLVDNQIHMLARIVMVADTFDALVSDRNQREALSIMEALSFMSSQSNKLFHAEIVQVLNKIVFPYGVGQRVKLNVGFGFIDGFDNKYNPVVRIEGINKKVVINHCGIKIMD